jgi:flagellar hook protein FlgE
MDALSGLQAHNVMFAATANNIANVNTEGYKPQQVNVAAAPTGGVDVVSISEGEGPVNLVKEIPASITHEVAYTALARVIETDQQLSGALIDMLG